MRSARFPAARARGTGGRAWGRTVVRAIRRATRTTGTASVSDARMSWETASLGVSGWLGNRHRRDRAVLSRSFAGGRPMPDDELRSPSLILRVVYEDLPDLIEVEARVAAQGWSGTAWAYISPHLLAEEARDLLKWTERLLGEFALEAGADTGIGWLSLRWYTIDRAGHLACHIRIATSETGCRPEGVRRLNLEFRTEPALVERFARQLIALAESLDREAILTGICDL